MERGAVAACVVIKRDASHHHTAVSRSGCGSAMPVCPCEPVADDGCPPPALPPTHATPSAFSNFKNVETPLHSPPRQLAEEKKDYDEAVAKGPAIPVGGSADLGMRVVLVHGDEVIGDSEADGGLAAACDKFKKWVYKEYYGGVPPSA